jgi:ABC-type Fe3+/spermidine/putrescine transport system ATPase subunit
MLRVERIHKRLGRFVLDVESLEVPDRFYFLLLGPSGCGKTVLLETLAGLNRPERGAVYFDGRDVTRVPPERRDIGFVYQRGWLFPNLTVEENIRFGMNYRVSDAGRRNAMVNRLAELMHLGPLLDRLPHKLSGGEAQRAAIARALAIRPRLLFLDEPLAALDPPTREGLARELKALHSEFGTTTIHVTHDHVEARTLADRVAVMFDGRIAQVGTPWEVFSRPAAERLARFVGVENIWQGTVEPSLDGGIEARVGALTLRVQTPVRGPASLCIRPEEITLLEADAPTTAENAVPVRLADLSDRGPVVRITAEAGGVAFVVYETQAEFRRRRRQIGDPSVAAFSAEAVHAVPAR